jgi:hypothetical protein
MTKHLVRTQKRQTRMKNHVASAPKRLKKTIPLNLSPMMMTATTSVRRASRVRVVIRFKKSSKFARSCWSRSSKKSAATRVLL